MIVTIKGLTEATITLNTINIIVVGEQEAHSIEISNNRQKAELSELQRSGLIAVYEQDGAISEPDVVLTPNQREEKKETEEKEEPVADFPTHKDIEQMEEDAKPVIGTPHGPQETKFKNKAAEPKEDTNLDVDESIKAMEKLQKEEAEQLKKEAEKEEDPEERTTAYISTGKGVKTKQMQRSVVPDQEEISKADPFIDPEEASDSDALIDEEKGEEGASDDPFVEI